MVLLPLWPTIIGLLSFHLVIGIMAPFGAKSVFLSRIVVGYAYFISLVIFWIMI